MFAKRMKELRTAHGINQARLGQDLSVTKQTVSNWENGNIQPSINMLIKIAKYFGVSADYLLGLDDSKRVNADNLTPKQLAHIQMIINDICGK